MEPINEKKSSENTTQSCPTGGCGKGKGMCPSLALGVAWIISSLVSWVIQMPNLQIPMMAFIGIILIMGFYPTGGRWFSKKYNCS